MPTNLQRDEIISIAFEILIKAVLVGLIMYYAFAILKPFLIPVLWGVILAVSLYPLIVKAEQAFKLKRTFVVTAFTLLSITALLLPTYMLSDSVINSSKELATNLHAGNIVVPQANEKVKEWPLIGEKVYDLWNNAASNLKATLLQFKPQIAHYSKSILSSIMGVLGGILGFVFSLIIAAIFLVKAESSVKAYKSVSYRLIGEKGIAWANLSALTIKSVAQGVLGIAFVQAIFAFIGMFAISVPFAWLWSLIVMFLTIIQLPALIILGPIIAYVFSYADATPATIFAIYAIIVGAMDGVLKPMFLGRGVDIPMLIILLGAIGGMMLSGLLGLFVGAVGLALAYKLFITWLEDTKSKEAV